MFEKSIVHVFEDQVKKFPFSIAVVDGERTITYRDLNKVANQLAHYLISRGVKSETLICICSERSIESIVGMIAVLKAGAAYCILEPSYPIDRLKFMLLDSNAPIILTQTKHLEALPSTESIILCLDDLPDSVFLNSIVNPIVENKADSLCYVMYVSGPNGLPIGVMIEHLAIINLVTNQNYVRFLPDHSIMHLSELSFNFATLEIWGALLNGAQLIVVREEIIDDLNLFKMTVRQNLNPCIILPTDTFETIIAIHPDFFRGCRFVIFGGESNDTKKIKNFMLQEVYENIPDRVVSIYGTAETTVIALYYVVKRSENHTKLPLGKPIENVAIKIINEYSEEANISESGELCIGGACVARGYWKNTNISSEKMIFSDNSRFFKTGDFVKCHDSGEIEFNGRKDNQIKIKQYRVELSEVEKILWTISDVEGAATNLEIDDTGHKHLTAYLTLHKHLIRINYDGICSIKWQEEHSENVKVADVSQGGVCLLGIKRLCKIHEPVKINLPAIMGEKEILGEIVWQSSDLVGVHFFENNEEVNNFIESYYSRKCMVIPQRRNFRLLLEKKLPEYMIPDRMYVLSSLPIDKLGNIDRRKLESLDKEVHIEPTLNITEGEEILMQLWREVLAIPSIKPTDDFFTLGGDSLLVTKILAKLKNHYNTIITYEEFFSNPSLSKLAVLVGNQIAISHFNPILTVSRNQMIGLSLSQLRIWFLNQFIPESVMFNLSKKVYFSELLLPEIVKNVLVKIVKRHEILRTTFSINDQGEPFQRISFENVCNISLVVDELLINEDKLIDKIVSDENATKFELSEFPLFKIRLLMLRKENKSVLVITCHRSICDEYSMEILINDIYELYSSEKEKRMPVLPELPVQFADYTVWQESQMQSNNANYNKQVEFWKTHLIGAPLTLELPYDNLPRQNPTHEIDSIHFSIGEQNLEALKKLSIQSGCTLYMTLFSSFILFLYMISGKRDMIVGTPVANRNQTEIDGVVGPFENILPIRVSFSPNASFINMLDEIKQILLGCYQNQELRFERILEIKQIKHELEAHPLFQIIFSFERYHDITKASHLGKDIIHEWINPTHSLFEFHMFLKETSNSIRGTIRYSKELFNFNTIKSWEMVWSALLSEVIKSSEKNLQDLSKICLNTVNLEVISKESRLSEPVKPLVPLTKTEKAILQIWKDILKVKNISLTDSFFDLGGHSLLIIRVISRIKNVLGKNIPVKVFFKDPTIKSLSAFIDNQKDINVQRIEHISYPSEIPLSFSQQRLWFIENLIQNSPVYNMPFVFKITGRISRNSLKEAVNKIVERHEILRTEFKTNSEGKPYQYILKKLRVPVELINIKDHMPEKIVEEVITKPFNIVKAPLFTVTLLEISIESWYLIFNFHHSISDGFSMHIFLNELNVFYDLPVNAEEPLSPLPIQYGDYALFQRRQFSDNSPNMIQGLKFWKSYLQDAPSIHSCPLDYERPIVHRYQGKRIYFSLPDKNVKKIKEIAQQIAGSDYIVFLSMFFVFLNKLSLQEDILISTPVSGRNYFEIESLIGFFVNMIPLRGKINPQISILDFIIQIKDSTTEAFNHQEIPYEKILSVTNVQRTLSFEPLCQIMFVLQNTPEAIIDIPHLQIEKEPFDFPVAKYDFTLSIDEVDGVYKGYIEYDEELFKTETIKKWKERWLSLIDDMTNEPELPIYQLSLLSKEEEEMIVYEWNETIREYPSSVFVSNMIKEQVEKNAKADALCISESKISYEQLNFESNRIAHILKGKGIKPNEIVGVFCDRSLELVPMILAVLKVNAVFLVLDPHNPQERLKYILNESDVDIILSKMQFDILVKSFGVRSVMIDSDKDELNSASYENILVMPNPNDLAYLIYTSGTTGHPKGVMIEQGAIADRLFWWREYFPLDTEDIFLNLFSPSFDGFLGSLLWPLASGATVLIPKEEDATNPKALVDLILEKKVTIFVATPTLLSYLFDDFRIHSSHLRKIISAGERLTKAVVEKIKRVSNCTIYNFYGPSECTIISSYSKVTPLHGPVSIGRPISNVKIYILDRFLKPVPIGMLGEIYIGGKGVSPGYINQPHLTEANFISNPYVIGEEIYKTGDMARWLENGEIEYKGRADNQIKLRGYRIELDEIKMVLSSFSEIEDVSVVVEDDSIVAYIVTKDNAFNSIDVRNRLSKYIPHYAIPDRIVFTNSISSNLLLLESKAKILSSLERDIILPRTESEKIISEIFMEILDVNELSVTDSFFDLGGHSLLITQLLLKIKSSTSFSLSLQEIYLFPTVELLAGRIDNVSLPDMGHQHSILSLIEQDIHLGDAIAFPNHSNTENGIFVTGGTGFLGSHIVEALLKQTNYDVYFLIQDSESSIAKSSELSKSYGTKRLFPVVGDLNKPKMGLRDEIYDNLCKKISIIYHCAANIHHLYSYPQVRNTNVLGSVEILDFASRGGSKKINFISILSACFDLDENDQIVEEYSKIYPKGTEGGYVISKWVTEKIYEQAVRRGFSIEIYRPSFILEDTLTGEFNFKNSHLFSFYKGALQAGIAPAKFAILDGLPVDFISKIIVYNSLHLNEHYGIYNLNNPNPISSDILFEWLEELGVHVKLVSANIWQTDVLPNLQKNNAFYPLASLYYADHENMLLGWGHKGSGAQHAHVKSILDHMKLDYPELDIKLFAFFIQKLINTIKK